MNKKRNIIIGLIVCVLLMTVVFFVFNHGKSNEQVVTEYFELLKKKDYKQKYSHIYPAAFYDSIEFYGDYEQQYKFEMLIYNRFLVEPISSKDDLKYYPNVKYKSFNFTIEEDAK